ncbi:MAG TPA: tRNA 2-thiouridine(34) synthase MnmA [Solirubrobacteraceae bacterium]
MTSPEALSQHLEAPLGRGQVPADAHTGAAGGAACGDLIRVSLALDPDSPDGRIADAGFDASGCGASIAAGSAVVSLVRDVPLLAAAMIGVEEIARELGGLSAAKRHAAELASDALHRALGAAVRASTVLARRDDRTLVAMSGGVDSAVAALLVTRAGEQAVGVTLELWSDRENDGEASCCSAQAVRGAREVAHGLGMPHLSIDLRAEFRAGVVNPWLTEHAAGETPNPCVRCNGNVRLDAMLELAGRLGARTLTTGHYARVLEGGEGEAGEDPRIPLLRTATDPGKDQSYVLAALAPESLARLRFPLGAMPKAQVRELAAAAGLAVANRRDSQDLCFLAGTRQGAFLARHGGLGERPGRIVDRAGNVLGEHAGAHTFTVGQRHGLGIGGGEPLYVLATDTRARTVTVGPRELLLCDGVRVRGVTLHRHGACVDGVKVRSRGRRLACRLAGEVGAGRHEHVSVELREPAERTAPGQFACLYAGDVIVGHGTVTV